MSLQDAIRKIHTLKKSFKTSQIKIIEIVTCRINDWYNLIYFEFDGKKYEYRETANGEAWIS